MVDMIDSTKVISGIAVPYKIREYYSIFLNSMSHMIKKYGAIINKNAGDSLIYYFPETSDSTNKSAFIDVIECGLTMMAAFRVINFKMSQLNLPRVDYRISTDYGKNIVAKSTNSDSYLFGHTMNICIKINSKAPPNGMIIGNALYQLLKSFSSASFFDDYYFKIADESSGLKQPYPVYSVVSKYKNENITMEEKKGVVVIEHLNEQQQKQDRSRNILLVDDEPDVVYTYESMLREEGYNVDTFTNSQQALKHFAQSDPYHYKLVLLDVRIPNLNGIQLYYRLKAINPKVKIIFVTALDVIEDELAALLPGFSSDSDLIKKPIERENYINRIKTALS
jgi:CheY-like chemotaxis protein/class 3 adenylate cyclase